MRFPSLLNSFPMLCFSATLSIIFNFFALYSNIDLEATKQHFVLNTKKIAIPEHPNAFNSSIVQWRGATLMSFRTIPIHFSLYPLSSNIGLVWLDDNFNPDGKSQILELNPEKNYSPPISRTDDARLITIDEHLYLIYSDNVDPSVTEGGFRVYVAELDYDGENFSIVSNERISDFEGENPSRREKNWSPFEYEGELMLIYSIAPHKILKPIFGTNSCQSVAHTWSSIHWNWGELRGGTPALRLGNQYLSFFHSSTEITSLHSSGEKILHYFIGAYTFEKDPPFKVTQISPEPIVGNNFYAGPVYDFYWKPIRAIFPCGFIFDEDFIWISYGRQDHEIWIVQLDRHELLNSLVSSIY
jgi:predicted GH43/DUF377 family glycosyl hydrolase